MPELTEGFEDLEKVLNKELVERREDIRCALLALIAGTSFFMVGEPGIAKSLLARRIRAHVAGGRFVLRKLDMASKPEDLFGPLSISALKDDRWERVTTGTLVEADWAMLDEVFAASSALLNTLLMALNEHEFVNGTTVVEMPLTTVLASSNEIPVDTKLGALYDRLLIRRKLKRTSSSGSFVQMLETRHPAHPDPVMTWDDVLKAQAEAALVEVPFKVLNAMANVRKALDDHDIRPSDRRMREALGVVRASAWLDGESEADASHLMCLADICWERPEQRPDVLKALTGVVNPLVTEVDKLRRQVLAVKGQIRPGLADLDRKRLALECGDKLKRAEKELGVLRRGLRDDAKRRKADEVQKLIEETSELVITELFQSSVVVDS